MFEKEAEEYVINAGIEKANDFVVYKIKIGENAWSLIVESKEELSCTDWIKIYEGSEEACHKFVDWRNGAEFGYNKANEWHYVKNGDLPPLNTNVLVIHRWAITPEVGKRIEVFINSSVWVWAMCSDRFRYTSDDENVIAWKEIVLPKEIE